MFSGLFVRVRCITYLGCRCCYRVTGVDAVAVGWFAARTDLNLVDSGGFEHNGCYIEQFKNN